MKKRVYASLLALALMLALLPTAAFAEGTFADVSDEATARNVEVLRLMGVISGDNNGNFRPRSSLTRAEFCKMAIELQERGKEVVSYSGRTIFPDVRPAHWAAGYVNLASTAQGEKQPSLMHGFPDGTFQPDKTISYGEAVTVLMRVLGYTDSDTTGLWPQGYIDLGTAKGLTKNLSLTGSAVISRAEAAQLFVNALAAEKAGGGFLKKLDGETVLLSIDITAGVLRTSDGKNPKMAKPMTSTYLNGLRGRVVYSAADEDKALTFLPTSQEGGGGTVALGEKAGKAVIVASDGSAEGFEALAGTRKYKIYRNGNEVAAKMLKRYDVATWSPEYNAIIVCDTRVTVVYADFMPSRKEPVTITALGGTVFDVLPMAQQSIARFNPGQSMVILLTADGQIAGAVEPGVNGANGNACGYVDEKGEVSMFCGASLIKLGAKAPDKAGQVVYISEGREGVFFTNNHTTVYGSVDTDSWTMGGTALAENVLVLKDGVLTSLSALDVSGIPSGRIIYTRVNQSGKVDLIVMGYPESNILYGIAKLDLAGAGWSWYRGYGDDAPKVEGLKENGGTGYYSAITGRWEWYSDCGPNATRIPGKNGDYYDVTITVDCGARGEKGPYIFSNSKINTGDFVMGELQERDDGSMFLFGVEKLECISGVTEASWIGTESVNANGRTYAVSPNTPCYCRDTGTWFGSVAKAIEYGGKMNLYLDRGGVVRVIEVLG